MVALDFAIAAPQGRHGAAVGLGHLVDPDVPAVDLEQELVDEIGGAPLAGVGGPAEVLALVPFAGQFRGVPGRHSAGRGSGDVLQALLELPRDVDLGEVVDRALDRDGLGGDEEVPEDVFAQLDLDPGSGLLVVGREEVQEGRHGCVSSTRHW